MHYRKHSLHHPSNGQRQVNLRMERWHRRCIYGVFTWLALTGALWLITHYFMRPVGEFGEGVHPLEPVMMKLHGAGVMVALFFVGSLLNSHLRRAIKSQRNLISGWLMIVAVAAMITTGYGLYYLANEQNRSLWSLAHWIIGLAFPVLVVLHVVLGRKSSL